MFVICGYNFCKDGNTLDPSPISQTSYNSVKLENGIFSHWYVTNDVSQPYSSEIPTTWEYLTVMDANFNGTLEAGNLDDVASEIDGLKIKRRKVGEFDWVTLKYISVENLDNFSFVFNDNLNQSNVEYEYALVPVSGEIEGNYITEKINSKFNGVFVCDIDTIYKFYAGVEYGTLDRVQKVGVFEPMGRKYPVVVSNALVNYETGSFEGTILPNDYDINHKLDNLAMVKEREDLLDFLTNKRAKILKDWNGNMWLMIVTDNLSVDFLSGSSMSLAKLNATWTEVGDANDGNDLYDCGMINEVQ